MNRLTIALLLSFVIVLTACGSNEPAPALTLVQEGELVSGHEVPAPVDEVVLTVTPAEETGHVAVDLDLGTVARLAQYELEVYEPFVERRVMFTGVRPRDLLTLTAPGSAARQVELLALDDYQITVDGEALMSEHVLLATHADGQPIPVDEGGPVRLVFSDDAPQSEETDLWIWSVRWMTLS